MEPRSLRPAPLRTGTQCPICFEKILPINAYHLECGHGYCRSCLFSWLSSRIKDREVKFECFHDALASGGALICKRQLSESDVESILGSSDIFQKWKRFKRMLADPSLRDCPFCGSLQSGSASSPDMTCTTCTRSFCYLHSNAHTGKTCQEYGQERGSQEALDEEFARRDTKPCPGCAAPTNKEAGCNSIRCVACHANWCWICGKVVDSSEMPTHFQWWNLGGCANKQFADGTENRLLSKVATYAYFMFLGIPSFMITAVMYVACGCACIPASLWYEQGPVAFFMTMTSMVSLALATVVLFGILGPILLPFIILYGLAVAICMPCYIYGQRKRRAQELAAMVAGGGTPSAGAATAAAGSRGSSSGSSTSGGGRSRTALMIRSPSELTRARAPVLSSTSHSSAQSVNPDLQEVQRLGPATTTRPMPYGSAGRPPTPRQVPEPTMRHGGEQAEDLYAQGRDQMHPSEMYRHLQTMGQGPEASSRRSERRASRRSSAAHTAVSVDEAPDPAPLDHDPEATRRNSSSSVRSSTAGGARTVTQRSQAEGVEMPDIVIDIVAADADPEPADKARR